MKRLFAFLAILCSFTLSAQKSFPILTADTTVIRLGEPITLTLSLLHQGTGKYTHISWPAIPDSLPGPISVTSREKMDTLVYDASKPDNTTRRQKFTITAFDSGSYVAGPFAVVINGDSVFSNTIDFTVKTIAVDTTQAFKDIKGVAEVPWSLLDWLNEYKYYIIASAVLILGFILAVVFLGTRRKKQLPLTPPKPRYIPPYEVALTKLRQLKEDKAWQRNDQKFFYTDVSGVIRQYIEDQHKVPALEQTSSELLYSLRTAGFDQRICNRLSEMLTTADLVKFAKQQPDEFTAVTCLEIATEFVQQTMPQTTHENTAEQIH